MHAIRGLTVSDHLIPILYIKRKEVPDGWNVYASRQIPSDNLSSDRHQILFLLKSLNKSEQLIYLYRIWESLLLSKYSINTAPHWLLFVQLQLWSFRVRPPKITL